MLPNFVIIGAQKSASTFVQTCLRDHPEVYMPDSETPFFESPDYDSSDISELERLFNSRTEKRLGIKRPSYIGKPEVPGRIKSHLPEAKLIAVLRNPVDRAISAYYHNMLYGFIPVANAEKGMRRLLAEPKFGKRYRRSTEIIEFGFYFKYLNQYEHFFKKDRMMVLLHEDIASRPLECMQKIFEYLTIDASFVPPSLNARPQKVIYSLPRLRLLSLRSRFVYGYNADRTRLFEEQQDRMGTCVDKMITKFDQVVLSRVASDAKPRISPDLRHRLYQLYRTDIEGLESLIKRPLDGWKM